MQEKQVDRYRRRIVEYGIRYQQMRRDWLGDLLEGTTEGERLAAGAP